MSAIPASDVEAPEVDQERLAAAIRPIDEELARFAANPRTYLSHIPTPCLGRIQIIELEELRPTRPRLAYVAWDGANGLPIGSGEGFNEMVARLELTVEDAATAVGLARLFLLVTRPLDRRYCVVETVEDLPWMPGPDDPAAAARQRREVAALVGPLAAAPHDDGGFEVIAWVVNGNGLDRVTLVVGRTGAVSRGGSTCAAAELLLTYTPSRSA